MPESGPERRVSRRWVVRSSAVAAPGVLALVYRSLSAKRSPGTALDR
jgi:hypothetical protein